MRESGMLHLLKDRVELGIPHVKGIVMGFEGIVLIEIECQSLIHPHRSEMPRRLVIHLSAPWATV